MPLACGMPQDDCFDTYSVSSRQLSYRLTLLGWSAFWLICFYIRAASHVHENVARINTSLIGMLAVVGLFVDVNF
jgi:hypothetical protein